jgi:hypothetical protein
MVARNCLGWVQDIHMQADHNELSDISSTTASTLK